MDDGSQVLWLTVGTWTQSRSAFSNVIQCPETRLERKPNTETSTNNGPGTFVRHRIIFDRLATASVNRGGGRVNDRETSAFRARLPRANNNCANLQVNPFNLSLLLFFSSPRKISKEYYRAESRVIFIKICLFLFSSFHFSKHSSLFKIFVIKNCARVQFLLFFYY